MLSLSFNEFKTSARGLKSNAKNYFLFTNQTDVQACEKY